MIELRKLGPDNVRHAMVVVTEALEREAAAGERDEDFSETWFEANEAFSQVANGADFSGLVGYERGNPVAVSLLRASDAYGEGVGVFDWFYVSPTVKASTFPLRLATETIKRANGLDEIVAFVGMGKEKINRVLAYIGLKPVEIEFRGKVNDFPDKVKRRLE